MIFAVIILACPLRVLMVNVWAGVRGEDPRRDAPQEDIHYGKSNESRVSYGVI